MIHNGKVPTNPEVKLLHDKYGRPEKGREFTHEEISEVIGETYPNSRYRTITTTWRKQVFSMYAVIVDAIPGVGFKVLEDSEGLRFSDKQFVSSGKKLKKAAQAAISIDGDKLSPNEKRVLDHRIVTHAKLQSAFVAEQRRKLTD
jgi:hypothetical protein